MTTRKGRIRGEILAKVVRVSAAKLKSCDAKWRRLSLDTDPTSV